ncbi:MAG TPA: efflux transporter outer membrane subunit [Kiritimatiellia bacterium]|nr:efflux transporter outer membrane subunit [Kiritimatiellia bacterium]HMP35464.1 efflux transporter outer membrane subunit [Kiritimatiellia bacterium]
MKRLFVIPAALLAAGLLTGCATGPDYRRPELALPETWRLEAAGTNTLADLPWASLYRDPVLSGLITEALTNNLDVRIAVARIDEAIAAYRIQRADLLPALNGSGRYTKARVGNLPPLPGAEAEQFDFFGVLSYELDVWGRIRRLNEAAKARYLATEEAAEVVRVSLVAGVASTYFQLRSLDRQVEIAEATLVSRSNSLELTRIKFDDGNGIVSELDVAQALTQVASTKSSIASLRRAVAVTENALAVLVGGAPRTMPRGWSIDAQWGPDDVPAGLPSDLLLRRPDLRAAEQQLIAANADIGAARAAYFPSISLTGALGVQSEEFDDLFDTGLSRAWNITPSITAPIFNGGKIRAGVRVAEARQRTALATYEQAIQTAFREVEDALIGIQYLREQLAADDEVVAAERHRLDLAYLRYEGGVASYSDVLDAQRFLFNAELAAVQTRNDLLNATVQLYKALGGGPVEVTGPEPVYSP